MMPLNSILIIDPFRNLLNAYRMILEEEKYLVETALNLKEAYEFFNRTQYSVIITEYIPPFEGTDQMVMWVKKNSPETYIIMVTNVLVDERIYKKLFDIGVDDFILKPYSPEKVLVHIRKGLKLRDLIFKVHQLERISILEPIVEEVQGVFFNLTYFKKCLRQELKKANRHQHSFSLLLLKVPTKEKIGDRFDFFYKELVKIVRMSTREEDMVGKNNGDIGILLPETNEIGSNTLMQRLINLIQAHPSFKSDEVLRPYLDILSFQCFTYPDQFALPESLEVVLEEMKKEYPHS